MLPFLTVYLLIGALFAWRISLQPLTLIPIILLWPLLALLILMGLGINLWQSLTGYQGGPR